MKLLQYIQYFFYVGTKIGWRIAIILIRDEIRGEKKYGINTTGADELKNLKMQGIDTSHATMYMPVSYKLLEKALQQISSFDKNHFFDIGCGKGRAMCIAAHAGFTIISGIDFSKEFCEEAEKNLFITKQQLPVKNYNITVANAIHTTIPPDVDCIFLFNPFDEEIMKSVVNNILQSLDANPRKLNIVYANPRYKKLFINNDFSETYYTKKLQYFEIAILTKK